jgi:putative PIN family toxin of toxin-antitoxin system
MNAKRVVLDTNVCLDLFAFRDPRWSLLSEALAQGRIEAVTRADCKMEWQLVIAYPSLPLDEDTRKAAMAAYDARVSLVEAASLENLPPLPTCRDGDDQKFLELAQASGAAILITKDKALLKLAARMARMGSFRIVSPAGWTSMQSAGQP